MKFLIIGMSCAACSARIEKSVSSIKDVTKCEVNLLTSSMTVELSPDSKLTAQEIIKTVRKTGYDAKEIKNNSLNISELPSLLKRLILSIIFLLLILFSNYFPRYTKIIQILLTVAIIIINRKFFTKGFTSLFHGSPTMDTLVALGSTAAFIYKDYHCSAMILTLITIGKTLEAYAKGRTTDAIRKLMELTPKTAFVLRNNEETEISVEDIQINDILIVRPGSIFPVDGIITEGSAAIDESSITGESIPVDKQKGDSIVSGTLNLNGLIKYKATKIGQDTTIAKIIQMVSDSAATKAPVQKLADKVSSWFVPSVIAIAFITFITWFFIRNDLRFAVMQAISVLVVSCPCALGLATPVAIMVGNGIGAKKGILFKTSISLEKTGKIRTVVLDKTGTITKGKPVVTESIENGENTDFIQIAYELEKNSTHPIAKAICNYALSFNNNSQLPFSLKDFNEKAGSGVQAIRQDTNDVYFCGKIANSNYVCVTKNGKTIGKFKIQDEVKPDSAKAVEELKKLGVKVVMLTGDNETNARFTANEVGIDNIIAGVLPGEKARKVAELQKDGEVAMVGDGINDAPSLSCADVGIAVGGGSDIAIDSADVVLVKNSIYDVVQAIKLSRKVLKNIKENLFWALFYNLCSIPIAAGCFYFLGLYMSPVIGAACMSLSSFCVVCNALRLNLVADK